MRARLGLAMNLYWDGIVQLIDVIAMIGAVGAIGGLPALLNALLKFSHHAMTRMRGLKLLPAATFASHLPRHQFTKVPCHCEL